MSNNSRMIALSSLTPEVIGLSAELVKYLINEGHDVQKSFEILLEELRDMPDGEDYTVAMDRAAQRVHNGEARAS